MLKALYNKSKVWFAVMWIVAYCILLSAADALSTEIGVEKVLTLPAAVTLSLILFLFLKRNALFKLFGLCRPVIPSKNMLYYIPLAIMLTANLWFGVVANFNAPESTLYILTMFCVGFLEEVIFRGLLFGAMREDNPKAAVIVSSITFGIGHIINLINGSGAELLPNILQVVYATAAGFMFVMIYCKTGSLIICIATHSLFNALSVFAPEAPSATAQICSAIMLTVITGSYAAYIALTLKRQNEQTKGNNL